MNAELIATLTGILAVIAFLVMVAGLFKPTWVIRRPSLQSRKGVFFVWGIAWLCLTGLSGIIGQSGSSNETLSENVVAPLKLYVRVERANVRQCPLLTCDVIDTFTLNSWVTTAADSLAEAPEWIEVRYDADHSPSNQPATGYINKITLAENPVSGSASGSAAGQPPSGGGGSTSSGGITIGPWNNLQVTVGEYREFIFCEPATAISGATCGQLAGATTDPRGGTPPYSFVKASGFLPPGMTLELNGTLKGTPAQTGTYNFKLCAKDLYGEEGCQNLEAVVKKVATPPTSKIPDASTGVELKINSMSCSSVYRDDYDRLVFSVSMSGTASGPVGTYLSFWSSPPNDAQYTVAQPYSILAGMSAQVNSGSWTEEYRDNTYSHKRAPGDPATTAWEIHGQTVHLYDADVQNSTMTRVNVAVVNENAVPDDEIKMFKDVGCPS